VRVKLARPDELRRADALLVAVKSYDMEAALESLRHVEVGCVLSVANGVFKNELLARFFGREKTLGAATGLAGGLLPDGAVRFTVNAGLLIGELPRGRSERVQRLAGVLDGAGVRAEESAEIETDEWSKYVVFVGLMPVAVLSRLETYRLLQDPALAEVVLMLQREMARLAAALRVPLRDGWLRPKTVTSVPLERAIALLREEGDLLEARGATAHKVSALQDLERGRPLEVEEILGYAVRQAREMAVAVPALQTCYLLLTGINRHLR
jgi:2-dehydropantoate 2-reductase